MSDIIAFASGKGGVGKSTLCIGIASVFACGGKKILLVDCDEGLNSLDIMLNMRDKVIFGWNDVADGNCTVENALVKCGNGIDLLCSPQSTPNREKLTDIICRVKDNYDYVFMDAPAGIGDDFKNTVKCCNKLIIVSTADVVSVSDGFSAYRTAADCGLNTDDIRLLINRFDKKAAKKSKLLNVDGVIDKTGIRLLGVIPEDKNIMYSSVTGKTLSERKKFISSLKRVSMRIQGIDVELKI